MTKNERSNIPRLFFTKEEIARISEAISLAERNTQGEIRIHIEQKCEGDPLERAKVLLKELGIVETKNRTGLLIYIALENHRFAIFGDEGIHRILGDEGWTALTKELSAHFQKGEFCEGVINIISKVGEILSKSFPALCENINEIPNEPTFGNE